MPTHCLTPRQRLQLFYAQHNPAKLPAVDELLTHFRAREGYMFEQLHIK